MPKWLTPENANVRLAENQEEYETIDVRCQRVPLQEGGPPNAMAHIALLQFTPEELRALINNSGQITLCILGNGWPPCSVHVGDPLSVYPTLIRG